MGMLAKQMRGRQVDLMHRPVPSKDAVVLTAVNDEACGGAVAPSLTAAARAGALERAAGTREWLRGDRTRECGERAATVRHANFPLPIPARCSEGGKRKRKSLPFMVIVAGRRCSHPNEPVAAVAGFDDAAGRSQRGKPLIEGCCTDTAFGPQLPKGKRGSSIGESTGDTLVQRAWRRSCGFRAIRDVEGQGLSGFDEFDPHWLL